MTDKQVRRLRALEAAVGIMEALQRLLSTGFTLLVPKEGMDTVWDYLEDMRRTLQEMMAEEKAQIMDDRRRANV
jgi:hypothetical protein